jgi:hypothetical protein
MMPHSDISLIKQSLFVGIIGNFYYTIYERSIIKQRCLTGISIGSNPATPTIIYE